HIHTTRLSMVAPFTWKLTDGKRKQPCGLLGNVDLSLLYKASVHGYQASAFHQRCDRQGPTLLVAYNRSGYIFGGYTSVDYTQSGQYITDREAFLFSFQGKIPVCIKVNSGYNARIDDAGQLCFCYNNQPVVLNQRGNAFSVNTTTMYGNDTQLTECEVYKVKQSQSYRRAELMEMIRNHKPLMMSVSRVRILMIGPVGAGKSSFFNSINSIFMSRITSKAMSGSAGTSLTTQFRTYPVKDGREGKPLPFVLCDTMGLEEQTGAGLDIEDISSILQGHVPDRYKQRVYRPSSLQEKIHCTMSSSGEGPSKSLCQFLHQVKGERRSHDHMVCSYRTQSEGGVVLCLQVQEVSSRLGVPVSCVLPVKNYSQELELELNCDVLLTSSTLQTTILMIYVLWKPTLNNFFFSVLVAEVRFRKGPIKSSSNHLQNLITDWSFSVIYMYAKIFSTFILLV
uniref:Interferon-induced protein 44-like n=1 Tax=Sinocyclocheilus anshuiensis TaxID=1608454 RepID=A0A671SN90_9TELE